MSTAIPMEVRTSLMYLTINIPQYTEQVMSDSRKSSLMYITVNIPQYTERVISDSRKSSLMYITLNLAKAVTSRISEYVPSSVLELLIEIFRIPCELLLIASGLRSYFKGERFDVMDFVECRVQERLIALARSFMNLAKQKQTSKEQTQETTS